MFGKKPPDQSQSFNNVTMAGGMVQAGQAGGDLQQAQSGQLETGVLCTTPQKVIVQNKTNESYFKKPLDLCLRLKQTLHSREASRNFISGTPAFHKV